MKHEFQYNIHITAFCHFWEFRNFGREIDFSKRLSGKRLSDGLVQHIPH